MPVTNLAISFCVATKPYGRAALAQEGEHVVGHGRLNERVRVQSGDVGDRLACATTTSFNMTGPDTDAVNARLLLPNSKLLRLQAANR